MIVRCAGIREETGAVTKCNYVKQNATAPWIKESIEYNKTLDYTMISHGICPKCFDKTMKTIPCI